MYPVYHVRVFGFRFLIHLGMRAHRSLCEMLVFRILIRSTEQFQSQLVFVTMFLRSKYMFHKVERYSAP